MSVLGVAESRRQQPQEPQASSDTLDLNAQGEDNTERVDIAYKLSKAAEDFLNAVIPSEKEISVDWGSLSPLFGVLGDIFAVAFTLYRWVL